MLPTGETPTPLSGTVVTDPEMFESIVKEPFTELLALGANVTVIMQFPFGTTVPHVFADTANGAAVVALLTVKFALPVFCTVRI